MPDRTYNEDEVADLLKRAAELQAREAPGDSGPGLTLEELAAIAADAGLDPQHVRAAAAELRHPSRRRRAESRITSTEIVAERLVPGELSSDAAEDVIAELRHRFDASSMESLGMGSYGKSSVHTVGRSIEWQHTHPWYGTHRRVLIQPREGATRIRVAQSNPYSGAATGWTPLYAPMLAFMAGVIFGPASGSFLVGALVALVVLAVTWPIMTTAARRSGEKHRRDVDALADDIASHVTPPVLAAGAARQGAPDVRPASPRLDLGETEEEAAAARAVARDRARGG